MSVRLIIRLCSIGVFFCTAIAAQAQSEDAAELPEEQPDFSVGVGVGTFGFVVEPQYRLGSRVALRVPLGFGEFQRNDRLAGVTYDSEVILGGAGLLADFFPAGQGFRISGGVLASREEIGLTTSDGRIEIGGTVYGSANLRGSIEPTESIQPVLAFGYSRRNERFSLDLDLGVRFSGGATARVDDLSGTVDPIDLELQERSLEREMGDASFLPFIKVGGRLNF